MALILRLAGRVDFNAAPTRQPVILAAKWFGRMAMVLREQGGNLKMSVVGRLLANLVI
jgi:hypothetical protein